MKSSKLKPDGVRVAYQRRYDCVLVRLAMSLGEYITAIMKNEIRIDRISARAKDVDRFTKKAITTLPSGKPKYSEPLSQIQDQIGARVVVFYKSDVDRIAALVKTYFHAIEYRKVVPDTETEFGYFGLHFILATPTDIIEGDMDPELVPGFFELQIKTLFQHAWSEADHDLGYKPGESRLTPDQQRLIAFTSAQSWGADHIFDQLFLERSSK